MTDQRGHRLRRAHMVAVGRRPAGVVADEGAWVGRAPANASVHANSVHIHRQRLIFWTDLRLRSERRSTSVWADPETFSYMTELTPRRRGRSGRAQPATRGRGGSTARAAPRPKVSRNRRRRPRH